MTHRPFSSRLFALSLPLALCACGLTDWADANMPVIGERCEHWQCFTESGQEQSKLNHDQRVQQESQQPRAPISGNPPSAYTAAAAPAPAAAPVYTAPDPMASGMPAEPTYTYVPRSPSAPGTTPYDGVIPPLEDAR